MTSDRPAHETDEIEITPEMEGAGVGVVLGEVGGAGLGSSFSAADLAREVFLAMWDRMEPSHSEDAAPGTEIEGTPRPEGARVTHHPSYWREVWDAAHKLAMAAEYEPHRIASLTRRLYDLALSRDGELDSRSASSR